MNFKSLLKTYSIPLLIVVLAMGVYFFVFLSIKNDVLPKTQHLDNSYLAQLSPVDSLLSFLGLKTHDISQQTQTKETPQTPTAEPTLQDITFNPLIDPISSDENPEITQAETPKLAESPKDTDINEPSSEVKPQDSKEKEYVIAFVQVSTAVIRSAPSTQSPSITTLSSGRRIEVVSFDDEWFEVKEPSGGYVAKRLVRLAENKTQESLTQSLPATPQPTQISTTEVSDSNIYEVLASRVNVRSAPNTDAPIIASLSLGQTVRVSSFNDGWATITLDSGRKAYIVARAIKKV